jgi:hypothetical protein
MNVNRFENCHFKQEQNWLSTAKKNFNLLLRKLRRSKKILLVLCLCIYRLDTSFEIVKFCKTCLMIVHFSWLVCLYNKISLAVVGINNFRRFCEKNIKMPTFHLILLQKRRKNKTYWFLINFCLVLILRRIFKPDTETWFVKS